MSLVERTDLAGPGTAGSATRYEYDALDRMTAVVLPSNERREFTYDALSRRMMTVTKAGTAQEQREYHVYTPWWETAAEYRVKGGMSSAAFFSRRLGRRDGRRGRWIS